MRQAMAMSKHREGELSYRDLPQQIVLNLLFWLAVASVYIRARAIYLIPISGIDAVELHPPSLQDQKLLLATISHFACFTKVMQYRVLAATIGLCWFDQLHSLQPWHAFPHFIGSHAQIDMEYDLHAAAALIFHNIRHQLALRTLAISP